MKQFIFILLMISALWMSGKTSPIVDDIPCTTYNVRTEKVGRYIPIRVPTTALRCIIAYGTNKLFITKLLL